MKRPDDIGDWPFGIINCQRRVLVVLDNDWARVRSRWSVKMMMYVSGCVWRRCAEEAKSRSQQRAIERIGRWSYIKNCEAGENERINLPPREGLRWQSGHCKGRDILAVQARKGWHNLSMIRLDHFKNWVFLSRLVLYGQDTSRPHERPPTEAFLSTQ